VLGLWVGVGLQAHAQTETVTYVYTDPQGTPLVKADASGNVIARYDYTPYGNAVASLGSPPNGPGTGHVNDPETGLVYMQARYYDPARGGFLSVDPVAPTPGNIYSFNRYGYASNNPIMNIDPDGRQSVGEMIDDNAMAAASQGNNLATYGWAFAGTAWNFLGAEGVSQVADKGTGAGAGNGAMAVLEVATLGKGGTVLKAGEAVAEGVAKISIKGITGHAVDQAINRGVKAGHILDAIKNPLKVAETKVDALGRESQKIIGAKATVVANPGTGKIVTVYPTSTKTAEKLLEKQQ
jgi:RHS repeat-associated protein